MKHVLSPQDVTGKTIRDILLRSEESNATFDYTEAIVVLEDGTGFCVDSCGVDNREELRAVEVNSQANNLKGGFEHLCRAVSQKVSTIAVCDSLPSLVVVTDNQLLVYGSDLGPPFQSFGPVVQNLGEVVELDELIDFWTRKPCSLDVAEME